ncbi:PaaI family thioesterase [Parahaliea mediterranea]|uniref:PaaI family thioesterase n=1 Tax=Parahaliea mediterranea TaxID=651086 RepID=UPI001F4DC9FD|nr:PaaI family thioesterase [Parahaliea mediterranea]
MSESQQGMSAAALEAFFRREFPHSTMVVESVGGLGARLRQPVDTAHLRPGGTVSGPTLMALADAALYAAILGEIGQVALAVTTSLNVNFLRKPAADCAVIAECRLLKLGKLLATGEVSLYSEGSDAPVAHAVGTYAIPPRS